MIDYVKVKAEADKLRQDLMTQRWYNTGLRQQIATIAERMRSDSRDGVPLVPRAAMRMSAFGRARRCSCGAATVEVLVI